VTQSGERGRWDGPAFNLSIPHKVVVIEHLDRLAESAQIIGAVNCLVRVGDELVGENADGQGFSLIAADSA